MCCLQPVLPVWTQLQVLCSEGRAALGELRQQYQQLWHLEEQQQPV
jgi:hypothetical protein